MFKYLLLIAVLFFLEPAFAQKVCFEGKDKTTEALTYIEKRCRLVTANGRATDEVQYFLSDGKDWGSKKVDYSKNPYLPKVELKIPTLNYELKLESIDSNKIHIKLKSQKKTLDEILEVPMPAIVDAGLDVFIKENLRVLRKGKVVEVNMVVPEFGDYFRFELNPVEVLDDLTLVSLEPSSIFLSWFAEPILLWYDREGNLIEYKGISDIKGPDQKNLRVHFKYVNNSQLAQ